MESRSSGILLHISSLPSPYGIGDLGDDAYRFADFLYETGQRYWQILPLNPTSLAYGNSPYSSISVFAGNSLFISPEILFRDGLINREDEDLPGFNDGYADYRGATNLRNKLVYLAYQKFRMGDLEELRDEFNSFCTNNSYWLNDYALFSVLKTEFNGAVWSEWPEGLRDRKKESVEEAGELYQERINREKFAQFLFRKQWIDLREYCNKREIRIIGDLPIYPNYDSADVWSNQDIFKLDENRKPVYVAGVPPDYFSSTGQLWGNPVYNWERMRENGFKWWAERIGHNLGISDIVRIDHFRGLVAYWEVPYGHETAMEGKWVDVPWEDFFNTMKSRFAKFPVIAEDLGTITPDVREVIKKYDFPGMKVLMFAFGDDFPGGAYLPHNYERNFAVYTGTHDNNTSRGWYRQEATNDQKARLSSYTGDEVNEKNVSRKLIRLAMGSIADTAIIPMQDLLDLDENARMNKPSTAAGNWSWRLRKDYYSKSVVDFLSEITRVYERY